MASILTTSTLVPTTSSTDWQLANRRAQDRIIRLQEQRAREAAPQTRLGALFSSADSAKPAFRVGQLDTELLDEELLDLLKGQLWGGLKYFRVCACRSDSRMDVANARRVASLQRDLRAGASVVSQGSLVQAYSLGP